LDDEVTDAVFETGAVRLAFTRTVIVTLVEALGAIVPRFQVTVPADSVPPPVADTKVVPAGRGSVNTAAAAAAGPLFVTPIV
jgi:hypothetical protein